MKGESSSAEGTELWCTDAYVSKQLARLKSGMHCLAPTSTRTRQAHALCMDTDEPLAFPVCDLHLDRDRRTV